MIAVLEHLIQTRVEHKNIHLTIWVVALRQLESIEELNLIPRSEALGMGLGS
jgi:hypothetical protein